MKVVLSTCRDKMNTKLKKENVYIQNDPVVRKKNRSSFNHSSELKNYKWSLKTFVE